MKISEFVRCAFSSCVAATLVGCGGSQIGGLSGALPQGAMKAPMRPLKPSSNIYLYVREYGDDQIAVLTFPDGKSVRTLKDAGWLCTDPNTGNLFVVGGALDEYSPGGASKIADAPFPGGYVEQGCAVDPTTGSIAIAGALQGTTTEGMVMIYSSLSAAPTIYLDAGAQYFTFDTYDDQGNLFVDGTNVAELPKGESGFTTIGMNQAVPQGTVQWIGKYLTIENPAPQRTTIYQVSISDSEGTVVGQTRLGHRKGSGLVYSWVQGKTAIAPWGSANHNVALGYWRYPRGGRVPHQILTGFDYADALVTGIASQ